MSAPVLYLAGPTNGCTDAEAWDWRRAVAAQLGDAYAIKNPMTRDYRGREAFTPPAMIVEPDLEDLRASDVVLFHPWKVSAGTLQEQVYAFALFQKHVVVIASDPSPWVRYHAHLVVASVEEAVAHLLAYAGRHARRGGCGGGRAD